MKDQAQLSLLDAAADDELFAPWFRDRATWTAWFAFVAALFGLPMTKQQLAIYRACTGRVVPPVRPFDEAWLVCGRRAGKSFVLALIAVYLACFREYERHLQPGERGTIMVVASDRKQAKIIIRYCRGLLNGVPMLAEMLERENASGFDLNNSVTIEVGTASFRATRGYTIVAALLDELAFFRTDDAADPDHEIIAALRPGMATIPGAMLLCASSPYARRGALWDAWKRWHGRDDAPALVWQAPTRTMNPTVPQSVIDIATARDPASASAEYGAQFRTDIESFVSREAVELCVEQDVRERAPLSSVRYSAFVDPSGGSSDSFTLAISHREREGDAHVSVLDAIRERKPPFSPSDVVEEFSKVLRTYRVNRICGDRYAGEFPRELFANHGIKYEPNAKPKSDIYRDTLPLINSGRVSLLDHPRLVLQLCGLERKTGRGGRDSIDHAPGGHDDVANAACGALVDGTDSYSAYTHAIMNNVGGPRASPTSEQTRIV